MNQRIQELADQAGIKSAQDRAGYDLYRAWPEELEKFAELIVQECAKEVVASHKFGNDMAKKVVKDAAKSVKKHFGIK